MKSEIITQEHKQAARFARALGHPVRIFILKYLDQQACCYSGDLSEILPIAKSTLSQHLKELKKAGLIQGETEAPRIRYCINRENWQQAKKLMQDILG
ncbi:MAG: ArsR/SmtB family transcription factor [Bacteroidota bacterium]